MKRLQVLLTSVIMLLVFRPEPLMADAPVVCNDGQIPVSVARAYKDMNDAPFTSDWTVQGWYTVSPGQCSAIGPVDSYSLGGLGWSDEDYSVTLLAFAFTDSTGVWGAARARATESGGDHYGFKPSNQQLCVQYGTFVYTRDTSKGEPAKACDELAGYYRIPVSLAYYGQIEKLFVDPDKVHVSLGPTDRAIPLGTQGPSQASSNAPAAKPPEDGIGTQILKALAKAAAEDRQKQDQAAKAQGQPDLAATTPPPPAAPSSPPASPPADDPIGGGGFVTPPTSFKVLLCLSADVANNSSWSQPEAGSKMAAFKNLAASYIISVAKPGWEYWIAQGQYERFDPAATTSGAQFVSVVSPDSGRFDEFDPKCPSGYAAFWVQVNH